MSVYTYVVRHDIDVEISYGDKINGGELLSVSFYDADKRIEDHETQIKKLTEALTLLTKAINEQARLSYALQVAHEVLKELDNDK